MDAPPTACAPDGPPSSMLLWPHPTAPSTAARSPAHCRPHAVAPALRQHSIGHYEPLHLSSHALVAQHQAYRKRRGMSSYTTAKVAPVELDFKAHGRWVSGNGAALRPRLLTAMCIAPCPVHPRV